VRPKPIGAPGPKERRKDARIGKRERVRRPVGCFDEGQPCSSEIPECPRRDAREVGVDHERVAPDLRKPCCHCRAQAIPRIGHDLGPRRNNRAIVDGIGFTAETTQGIWKDHPEKTLGTTAEFVAKYPNAARAMTAAIIDAGRWIDASLSNRQKTAQTVADRSYVNTDSDVILARMLGRYDNGIGTKWDEPDYMKFYSDGVVNYPYLSDGMWFMTQHRRWGLLKEEPDYLAVAKKVNRIDIYKQAAAAAKASLPKSDFRTSKLIDGVVWDGKDPKKYAGSFKIKVA